jgi:adenylate kinase family enzyme
MNRVIVVGTTGSGKTTLAQHLGERMGCPFIELDALFWNPGWVQTPRDEFRQRVAEAISPERWAAGGNYGSARDLIWRRADTLVWLDYPLPLVMWRLFRRTTRRVMTQEELWNGNHESFRNSFLSRDSLFLWALKSHPNQRRTYPAELRKPEYTHLHVFRFHSPGETEAWLQQIAPVIPANAGIQ